MFLDIGPAVRREILAVTLSVEGCTDLKNIVHFYSMRVTKFCTRGGIASNTWGLTASSICLSIRRFSRLLFGGCYECD